MTTPTIPKIPIVTDGDQHQELLLSPGSPGYEPETPFNDSSPSLRKDFDSIAELGPNGEISEEKSEEGDNSEAESKSSHDGEQNGSS